MPRGADRRLEACGPAAGGVPERLGGRFGRVRSVLEVVLDGLGMFVDCFWSVSAFGGAAPPDTRGAPPSETDSRETQHFEIIAITLVSIYHFGKYLPKFAGAFRRC